MSENFDWAALVTRAKAVSFDPVPDGPYHVSVHEAVAKPSSNGKPMITLKLNIEDGPHQNRKLLTQLVLSVENETALAIFFRNLRAFGIDENFLATVPPGQLGPIAQTLLGRHVNVMVGSREWQGQQRNEVKNFSPYQGVTTGPSFGAGMPMPSTSMLMPNMGTPMPSAAAPMPTMLPPVNVPAPVPSVVPGVPSTVPGSVTGAAPAPVVVPVFAQSVVAAPGVPAPAGDVPEATSAVAPAPAAPAPATVEAGGFQLRADRPF